MDLAAGFSNALALHRAGRLDEAEAIYASLAARNPNDAALFAQWALCPLQRGDLEDGIALLDRALALDPNQPEALNNKGLALSRLGRLAEGIACQDRAIALAPHFAEAHEDRGLALAHLGKRNEAISDLRRAVQLRPNALTAWTTLSALCNEVGRYDEAMEAARNALARAPNYAPAAGAMGSVCHSVGRQEDSLAWHDRALALDPNIVFSRGARVNAKLALCDWSGLDADIQTLFRLIQGGEEATQPFWLLSTGAPPALHRRLAEQRAAQLDVKPRPALAPNHHKIRLGYFSSDYQTHATSMLLAGLIEAHDRARFEAIAFSYGGDAGEDAMRQRLVAGFDRFVDVTALSDPDIAALSRAMEIDIAIDLKGHTFGARPGIFAAGAAPIQVNYLGYPGTMGAAFIDYAIGDATVIPPGAESEFTEHIVRLPDSYQVNDRARAIAASIPPRAELGLPDDAFVFCGFNQSYKILPDVFGVWMRIIAATPRAVLWLLDPGATAARNLRREAAARGVAGARLIFAPRIPPDENLARLARADLFIDTFAVNAHTTAADALWAGLPVLTTPGDSFVSRVAASLLHAIALPELIAATRVQYEQIALELARDPARLAALRAKLAANRLTTPLFDTARYASHIEAAYIAMYERAGAGLPARDIDVAPVDE